MIKAIYTFAFLVALLLSCISSAEAYCTSYTTISNGTPADATQVMANFGCAALTSGSTIESLTSTNGQYFTHSTDTFSGYDNSLGLNSNNFLYLQGNSTGGLWLAGNHGRNNNIAIRDTTNQIDLSTNGHTSADLSINSSGYVGIGTASPTQKLYVSGNIYATGDITCGGTCGGGSYWSLSGSNLIPSLTSYNVGIGSVTSPTHTLDVGGSLNVTGALTCGSGCSAGPWAVSSGSIVPSMTSYNLGVGTTSPTAKLDVYGAGSSGIRALSGGSSSSTSFVVGRTGSEGYFAIAGAANQWALGTAAGDVVVSNPASGKLMLSSQASTVTPDVTVTAGKVGIGTTTPSQALDVVGSLNVSGSVTCGSGCAAGPWSVPSGTSNIVPSSASYNVGVGTTSPGHLLTVGNGSSSLNADIFVDGGTSSGNGVQIAIQRGGSSKGWLGTHSRIYGGTSDALALLSNGTLELGAGGSGPNVTVATNGNVGIGTTPFAWSSSSFERVVDIGGVAGIDASSVGTVDLSNNLYYDGTNWIRKTANYAQIFRLNGNNFQWYQGSSGSAGTSVSLTTPMVLDSSGNLTILGCINFNGGSSGTCASDERVKRDIRPFTSVGLAEISALRPVTYSYNGLGGTPRDSNNDDIRTGLIAQEVQTVAPGLVAAIHSKLKPGDTAAADLLEVKYAALTFGLINAVKELKAANENQAAEIDLLRTQVNELRRKAGKQMALQ